MHADLTKSIEEKVVQDPLKSTGAAFICGFVLSKVPVFSLFFVLFRVAVTLVRPALFVLGATKLWDLYKKRSTMTSQEKPEEHF